MGYLIPDYLPRSLPSEGNPPRFLPPQANPRATTARARRPMTKVRTRNGSGDALGDLYSFIASRAPGSTTTPTTTQTTTAIKLLGTASTLPKIATSFTNPTPTPTPAPAPIPTTFAPTAPTPVPVVAPPPPPPPSQPYDEPAPPPPQTYPSQPANAGGGSTGTDAGAIAQAAAPIVGAIDPMAGAATALIPALTNAANQPDSTKIRFSDDASLSPFDSAPMDAGPEVYNPDGTPVTPAAKAATTATFADKLKALPPAAKIGGAVALYLLFGR